MKIDTSIFSNPALRGQLEKYYEDKKASLIETMKNRDISSLPAEIKYKDANGTYQTAQALAFDGNKLQASLASFDDWLDIQQRLSADVDRSLEDAQTMLETMSKHAPDASSGVRATFSNNGSLCAYVNADGSVAASNGSENYLNTVFAKADAAGLSGQSRTDFLIREIPKALKEHYKDLETTTYTAATSPTNRAFAALWYKGHDVEQTYKDMTTEAQAHYNTVNAWHQQWESNINEIRSYLLGLQEAA